MIYYSRGPGHFCVKEHQYFSFLTENSRGIFSLFQVFLTCFPLEFSVKNWILIYSSCSILILSLREARFMAIFFRSDFCFPRSLKLRIEFLFYILRSICLFWLETRKEKFFYFSSFLIDFTLSFPFEFSVKNWEVLYFTREFFKFWFSARGKRDLGRIFLIFDFFRVPSSWELICVSSHFCAQINRIFFDKMCDLFIK